MKHINDKYMHLTNYSIQKKCTEYESNSDDTVCQGHKWYVSHTSVCHNKARCKPVEIEIYQWKPSKHRKSRV